MHACVERFQGGGALERCSLRSPPPQVDSLGVVELQSCSRCRGAVPASASELSASQHCIRSTLVVDAPKAAPATKVS